MKREWIDEAHKQLAIRTSDEAADYYDHLFCVTDEPGYLIEAREHRACIQLVRSAEGVDQTLSRDMAAVFRRDQTHYKNLTRRKPDWPSSWHRK